ncbi:RipA family octameric membrane protein [Candidatus Pantoea rara]|uniref:RipA family octameric membrane protein n=1 Tax=Candidatus Pantoea rara TaxID=1947037 RepID=UPI003EBEF6DA
MKITIHKEDELFMHNFFAAPCHTIETGSHEAQQIQQSLQLAIQQKGLEADGDWKRSLTFLLLFLFLYAALGASLTLDLSAAGTAHKSIAYALEAIPVLIAFSGFFISILYLFLTRASARKQRNWEKSILVLEKYSIGNLFKATHTQGGGTSNYSVPNLSISLSLFICVTWLVIYNYLTFTTSGVFGSVISLFISTMVYVILDIQLLKPFIHVVEQDQTVKRDADKEQD